MHTEEVQDRKSLDTFLCSFLPSLETLMLPVQHGLQEVGQDLLCLGQSKPGTV